MLTGIRRVFFASAAVLVAGLFFGSAATVWGDSISNFSLTDGSNTISFSLPTSPTPTAFDAGYYFEVDGISVTVNNSSGPENLYFFNQSNMGGLEIGDSSTVVINQSGMTVYGGTEQNPTFSPMSFNLSNVTSNLVTPEFGSNFTLTISSDVSVAEPGTLAMLGTGLLALLGAALFKKQRAAA